MTRYVGADGCPDGWVAVAYATGGFDGAQFHADIGNLWRSHAGADRILIDVPIGLRTDSGEPRRCDTAARELLSPERHHSVFPTPVRAAAHENSYQDAKTVQERRTDGSLNRQTWGITPKIAEVDDFLHDSPEARGRIRECHPEVCFCAFAGRPMRYSKTRAPERAYWERLRVLRTIEPDVYDHVWEATSDGFDADVSTDDLVDAFAIALTAQCDKSELRTLPTDPDHDDAGLPMEIVYRERR
jgi:predicted RNase H-like nuclease